MGWQVSAIDKYAVLQPTAVGTGLRLSHTQSLTPWLAERRSLDSWWLTARIS